MGSYIDEIYRVSFRGESVGSYYIYTDGSSAYSAYTGLTPDTEKELKARGLDSDIESEGTIDAFSVIMDEEHRAAGRKRIIYEDGGLVMEREPRDTGERFFVYRRSAEKGDPDYSPLPHDAPHNEGPHTPDGMREWASWYVFNKKDDGTYEAELDEAWWWGGGHNDGGTIRREIPEEWFELPYEEFLSNVVRLAAAAHYGFTPEMLMEREGLREFFGYGE